MRRSLQAMGLAGAMLAMGCGGSDDDFTINPIPINPSVNTFFVQNNVSNGNGTQASPFNNLGQAVQAAHSVPNGVIVIARGDGTSNNLATDETLFAGETLRGADPNQPPVLGGTITLADNTIVADVQLVNAPNSAGLRGNNLSGVTISNVLVQGAQGDGVSILEPDGVITVNNLNVTGNNINGLTVVSTDGASATLNFTNLQVSNNGGHGVAGYVSGSGTLNWNENGSQLVTPAAVFGFGWDFESSGTANLNLRLSNVLNDGSTDSGLRIDSIDDSNVTVVLDNSIIRNSASRGCSWNALDSSTFKGRVANTDLRNNAAGFGYEATSNDTATLALRFVGAISDVFGWGQNDPTAPFIVENLGGFGGENTGTISDTGTITDAPVGSQGIP